MVLDEKLNQKFIKFEAATHESRVIPAKKAIPEYFLWFEGYGYNITNIKKLGILYDFIYQLIF